MKTEGYLNARAAAKYVGYEPGEGPARSDKAMKAFYEFIARRKVTPKRDGRRLLFKREDLDRAIGDSTDEHNAEHQDRLERMAELARQHARGESTSCVH